MYLLLPNPHTWYLIAGIVFEIIANILLKKSHGFAYKSYGIAAIVAVLAAFTCLGKSIEGMELSFAYALWGSIGLISTALLGSIFFQQRITFKGWIGIGLLLVGILLLKL